MIAFLPNVGGLEWLVILFIALLIFGKKLPEVMRALGRSVNEFKKGMNDVADNAVTTEPAKVEKAPEAPVATAPVPAPQAPMKELP